MRKLPSDVFAVSRRLCDIQVHVCYLAIKLHVCIFWWMRWTVEWDGNRMFKNLMGNMIQCRKPMNMWMSKISSRLLRPHGNLSLTSEMVNFAWHCSGNVVHNSVSFHMQQHSMSGKAGVWVWYSDSEWMPAQTVLHNSPGTCCQSFDTFTITIPSCTAPRAGFSVVVELFFHNNYASPLRYPVYFWMRS